VAAAVVSIGTTPLAVAVNPLTNLVYAANSDSDSVSVVNGLKRTSNTYVICSSSFATAGESIACSALIVGASPSGQVNWNAGGAGSFVSAGGASCTISRNACTVRWQPGASDAGSLVPIVVTFAGDVNNKGSSGEIQVSVSEATGTTTTSSSTSGAFTPQYVIAFLAGVGVAALAVVVRGALHTSRKR